MEPRRLPVLSGRIFGDAEARARVANRIAGVQALTVNAGGFKTESNLVATASGCRFRSFVSNHDADVVLVGYLDAMDGNCMRLSLFYSV